jgi:hypothetical protein
MSTAFGKKKKTLALLLSTARKNRGLFGGIVEKNGSYWQSEPPQNA